MVHAGALREYERLGLLNGQESGHSRQAEGGEDILFDPPEAREQGDNDEEDVNVFDHEEAPPENLNRQSCVFESSANITFNSTGLTGITTLNEGRQIARNLAASFMNLNSMPTTSQVGSLPLSTPVTSPLDAHPSALATSTVLNTPNGYPLTNWYGHDMTQWPPSRIEEIGGRVPTFSWIYMPLILDAAGMSNVFHFPRPAQWHDWVCAYARAFRAMGITNEWMSTRWDGMHHLSSADQEELISMCVEGQAVTAYAWRLARGLIDSF
jgi:hypothetical protein